MSRKSIPTYYDNGGWGYDWAEFVLLGKKFDMNRNLEVIEKVYETWKQDDNIRMYVPLDLNREAILRRLDMIIEHYEEANERNEFDFRMDVDMYDQIWYGRRMPEERDHSKNVLNHGLRKTKGICCFCFYKHHTNVK